VPARRQRIQEYRARYRLSAKGQAGDVQRRQRRIWIGREYHSSATTAADAQRINAQIKKRMSEFAARQPAEAFEAVVAISHTGVYCSVVENG